MQLITREELKGRLDANQDVKLVMAVGPWEFRAKHIPGSLGFPSPRCALRELQRDDEIIVYANNHHRINTTAAYHALSAHGYRNVWCYAGGLVDWEDAGYPVEGNTVGAAADRRWPHGHSPRGRELNGACPHCDNGWSGHGWPPAPGQLSQPDDQHSTASGPPATPSAPVPAGGGSFPVEAALIGR
ncbi:MAG TPA: rhodanese-like domain-containing protein [Actinomycetes bacterium]|jgi:rhodanese-related sulfurtransferase|nr:rhodanese-like domain-containing protein [Actinomycetes bacterium]